MTSRGLFDPSGRYEWYWNVYQPGQLLFEIERLHKRHGKFRRLVTPEKLLKHDK